MDTIMKRIEDATEFQVKGDPRSFGGFGDLSQIDYENPLRPTTSDLAIRVSSFGEGSMPPSYSDIKTKGTSFTDL
ncbi:hypothetical protein L1887_06745 [Cichorium endivia]|nr:hypothetical protein L1887_06745 [Cichorium endivia]